ncbi:MAG: signal peptidase II [Planctomycetes bacterium RBG_16_59_8]|nr:MAG: signal peptidase II [Planctomycetes bacterium RBG_16_59_8]
METQPSSSRKHILFFFAVALLSSTVDILTKALAFAHIPFRESMEVIPGVLLFQTTVNTGIVFGMFKTLSVLFLIISIAAVPVIIGIFHNIRVHRWMMTIPLGSILGGAFGNMYDRIVHDGVRDFIYVKAIEWPIFNVADSVICVGVVLLSFTLLFAKEEKSGGVPEETKTIGENRQSEEPRPPQPTDGTGETGGDAPRS